MGTHPNGDISLQYKVRTINDDVICKFWQYFGPGPARLATTGQLLSDLVTSKPELLGEESRAKFGDKLPFLFKVLWWCYFVVVWNINTQICTYKSVWWIQLWSTQVLSVGKALSIQAHPDLPHAQQLHKERPEVSQSNLLPVKQSCIYVSRCTKIQTTNQRSPLPLLTLKVCVGSGRFKKSRDSLPGWLWCSSDILGKNTWWSSYA